MADAQASELAAIARDLEALAARVVELAAQVGGNGAAPPTTAEHMEVAS